ncbi:MAG TPA: DUF116 domain-containing protein [Anaerolineales bacterium]|nr:DUF116 domain-containing protein [Anaerolineales bacterium]
MQPITYSLKNQQKRSDQFYLDLSDFTDAVLDETHSRIGDLITEMIDAPELEDRGRPRTRDEHAFDALVLGVLWRVYANKAGSLAQGQRRVLDWLLEVRRNSPFLKPIADFFRGLIGGVVLFSKEPVTKTPKLSLQTLARLIEWLDTVGEFKEEVKRIEVWQAFLDRKEEANQQAALNSLIDLAAWFESASQNALGKYTPNVDHFLLTAHPSYRWREDYLFTGRKRVEYHLNMVGTEIMNRSFREEFLKAEARFIFVPPCMSAPQDGKCQATATPYGERCKACTPTCQVHQVTKLGEKYGIQVFMIPDSFSPLASSNGQGLGDVRVGVVGVSCPLTIVSGGYEMKRMGIPAQGLLLDHCGCTWHWDPGRGVITEINMKQLMRILEEDRVSV